MQYLIITILFALGLGLLVWLSGRKLRRREQSIRALLDGADALETQLHDCRQHMQRLRSMLTVLPEEMSATADHALSADAKVKAALTRNANAARAGRSVVGVPARVHRWSPSDGGLIPTAVLVPTRSR